MNLPTKITVFRMLMVPVLWGILLSNIAQELKLWMALILFVVASASDFLDGYLARKYNQITTLGKFLDPIADKILVNSLLVYLAVVNIAPLICVLLMITRDTLVDALRMQASTKQIVVAAHFTGKFKTVLQMVAITMALVPFIPVYITVIFMYIATIISLISGIYYFLSLKNNIF